MYNTRSVSLRFYKAWVSKWEKNKPHWAEKFVVREVEKGQNHCYTQNDASWQSNITQDDQWKISYVFDETPRWIFRKKQYLGQVRGPSWSTLWDRLQWESSNFTLFSAPEPWLRRGNGIWRRWTKIVRKEQTRDQVLEIRFKKEKKTEKSVNDQIGLLCESHHFLP